MQTIKIAISPSMLDDDADGCYGVLMVISNDGISVVDVGSGWCNGFRTLQHSCIYINVQEDESGRMIL